MALMKILGLDQGASFTKAVILENQRLIWQKIITTTDSLPAHKQKASAKILNEFNCLGQGGLFLAKKSQAVVISCGTGTAVVLAKINQPSIHLGGTGVGGGTLIGLGRLILNTGSVEKIFSLAAKGQRRLVDLTAGDILDQDIGLLNPDTTAANFAQLKSQKPTDLASALIGLVAETIGVTACLAAKTVNQKQLIFVGRLATNKLIQTVITKTCQMFKLKPLFPRKAAFATALGAALLALPKPSAPPRLK